MKKLNLLSKYWSFFYKYSNALKTGLRYSNGRKLWIVQGWRFQMASEYKSKMSGIQMIIINQICFGHFQKFLPFSSNIQQRKFLLGLKERGQLV